MEHREVMEELKQSREETIIAVTVTYNRAHTLRKTLSALEGQTVQINKIIIVDNHSNEENRREIAALTEGKANIDVLWMEENLGGAGGFEYGMRYGQEKYDPQWYWIMDDDAYPRNDCLEKLLHHKGLDHLGCLAPLIWGADWREYQLYHHKSIRRFHTIDQAKFSSVEEMRSVEEIDADAFVGTLFPGDIVKQAGFPDGGMFIYGDDTEYTTRIRQKYKIYLIKDAVIEHNDPPRTSAGFGPETYWKLYYTIRNKLLIAKKYNRGWRKIAAVWLLMGQSIWQVGYSLVRKGLGRHRFLRMRLVVKGTWDGLTGKKGKTVEPKKLF
ncbi:MAG: glycosyltransferase [Lachnospiraceae bacterium]|nr:glycosyltransferase [Lachnospiraceae bacterium]